MLFEASWALSWTNFSKFGHYVGSSWPLLGHLGAKMAKKMGKIATRSAKMSQDEPTRSEKGMKALPRKVPTGPESGLRRPPRRALRKEKTKESGRICKRLGKGFDEVIRTRRKPLRGRRI